MGTLSFLDRSHSVAKPGFSRWLVPPAALAIHLAIGQVYAFSVFKKPLNYLIQVQTAGGGLKALPGVDSPNPADWKFTDLGWIFSIAIVFLGLSAAVFGKWLEKAGPRKAMFASAVCFSSGFFISAIGVQTHQLWLIYLGYGVIGGIGLGSGYISPVSTLIKWFPDRPGMATGLAIMGFGGGALIASPWSSAILAAFGAAGSAPRASGIAETFLIMGIGYAVFMSLGWVLIRVPAPGWVPAGWDPASVRRRPLVTAGNVSAANAIKTPQFWLLWVVLCFNVTAGIGILERAAPIYQDFFAGEAPVKVLAAIAAGFVSILSLANMLGRFVWSSVSDVIGRKNMYRFYLGVGAVLYLVLLGLGNASKPVFVFFSMLFLSFYGAGFSTVPAYLRDLFGTFEVGAIHGRLLTAWSAAGVLGPIIVDAIADKQKAAGLSGTALYHLSFEIMIGLLVVGFVCNELIKPVDPKYHEPAAAATAAETGKAS